MLMNAPVEQKSQTNKKKNENNQTENSFLIIKIYKTFPNRKCNFKIPTPFCYCF